MNNSDLIKNIIKTLDDKKAIDIKAIEIKELTIVADCFIIASGTSSTHVKALAGEVEDALSKQGVEPLHIEGRAFNRVQGQRPCQCPCPNPSLTGSSRGIPAYAGSGDG